MKSVFGYWDLFSGDATGWVKEQKLRDILQFQQVLQIGSHYPTDSATISPRVENSGILSIEMQVFVTEYYSICQ